MQLTAIATMAAKAQSSRRARSVPIAMIAGAAPIASSTTRRLHPRRGRIVTITAVIDMFVTVGQFVFHFLTKRRQINFIDRVEGRIVNFVL